MSIRIQRLLLAAVLFFAFLVSSESDAAPPAFLVNSQAGSAPPARDGIYVQFTAGIGLPQLAITVDDPGHGNFYTESQSSTSLTGSFLLGLPVQPGLVLGGGILGAVSPTGKSTFKSKNDTPLYLVDVKQADLQSMVMVGPFIDFYPRATLGWHVQALVGYAALSRQNFYSGAGLDGIGLMAGVGYDWWVSNDCSVGILARVTYANAQLAADDADSEGISEHDTFVSPGLEASLTFH